MVILNHRYPTEPMTHDKYSRREFLGVGAAVAGASLVGSPINPAPLISRTAKPGSAAARVRFGMIGVGMQGNSLLRESIGLDGVECAGACDVYAGRPVSDRE